MTFGGNEKAVSAFFETAAHRHGFGRSGPFIEQGRIGDFQSGEVACQGLEIQQSFEPALGDFGLVRGILSVPAWILEEVPLDYWRRNAVVVTHADVGAKDLVLRGNFFE